MNVRRFDETRHLLLEWTMEQAPSERMAALILDEEGFESIDPAHPLGGRDGGADALVQKDGEPWVMAVYFPRGQQSIKEITDKLTSDVEKAKSKKPKPVGVAFVTNQELRLAEREELGKVVGDTRSTTWSASPPSSTARTWQGSASSSSASRRDRLRSW
jgi:hypothetical protein